MAADIGCDHGKLSAALAGSGRCPLVLACDLRPDPLQKARVTCAPYGERVQFRLGSGLQVLAPGEAEDIIIAGMGAETIIEILEAAPWVFDGRYNLVLVPATKHSILRRWLARRGFALRAETLCQAAGRWYAVMNAQYTGAPSEPDGLYCLTGLTQGQPGCADYYASQNAKLKKYRLGLPDGAEKDAVGALIAELDKLAAGCCPAYKLFGGIIMSVTVRQILGLLQAAAPQELALSWDNVGLLVDAGKPVDGVLTALDITPAVVREAVENDCQLIVSHHPVIFQPIKSLAADDVPALLMKNGISAICMHTNLDAAPGGVNDTLCEILGIAAEGRESFAEGCGRIGTTMPTTVEALAKFCADTLHTGVKYVNGGRAVTCLAEVSGGGGSYLQEAIDRGADCLVTGEAAHHIALLAKQKGIGLVVAGHWGTEHAIADVLAALIARQFPGLTVAHAEADTDPYCYLA